MEEFLRDYVESYIDCCEVNAEEEKVTKVVKFLCADDYWCNVLDDRLRLACERFGINLDEEEE